MATVAKAGRAATLVAVLALALASPAAADTLTVNTTADDASGCDVAAPAGHPCTLRGAMSVAADNPPSTVVVPAGRYVLTGHLTLGPGVTVIGENARTTIIDANGVTTADRAFWSDDVGSGVLSQMTITGGRPNAGQHGGAVGGDVLVDGGGTLTLDHVHVTGGVAGNGGGAAALANSSLVVLRSLVDGNEALPESGDGGGISVDGAGSSAAVQVSTITGNTALVGGAVSATGGGAVTLSRATIAANQGGGIAGPGQAFASIVAGNTATNCLSPLVDNHSNVESGTDCGFVDASDRQNADPALQPLSDNGGPTDTLALGTPSAARDTYSFGCDTDQRDSTAPKGNGCDAGAFEADPPPPPPEPPASSDHTLLGFVIYRGAFAPGLYPSGTGNPFELTPPPNLEVVLFGPHGAIVRRQNVARPSGFFTVPDFRFDDLGPCSGCRIALRVVGAAVVYSLPVDFDGGAGQTTVDLSYLDRPGVAVDGGISAPAMAAPDTLRVRIRDRESGMTLADTGTLSPRCAHDGGMGATCATAESYGYRLEGLPDDGRSVTYELLQQRTGGPSVVVDSAVATLAAFGGFVPAPLLTALDAIPSGVRGRTLIGTVSYLGAFAPGAQIDTRLSLHYAPGHPMARVRLRRGTTVVATGAVTAPTTGSSMFRLSGLPACENCTLELLNGPAVVDKSTVTLPGATSTSVTIRDMQLRAVHSHFLDGFIGSGPLSPRDVRVTVHSHDAHGPLIADSNQLPAACQASDKCDTKGNMAFRLDGMPNNTPVVIALLARSGPGWVAVDSALVTTPGADRDGYAGFLQVPHGFHGASPGRQLFGYVLPRGPFGPGAALPAFKDTDHFPVRLRDARGTVLATATATGSGDSLTWTMNGVPACDTCQVELLTGPEAQDRAALRIGSLSPAVTQAPYLSQKRLTGGLVAGEVVASHPSAKLSDLQIRLQTTAGRLISASTADGIPQVRCGPASRTTDACPRIYVADWQIPAGAASGPAVIVARDKRTGQTLASERVMVLTGSDTSVATLSLKAEH